jgi:ferredoxin--NADP+ reductase
MFHEENFQKVRIVERKNFSPDLWTMRMRPEAQLAFQAGQYVTLGLLDGGHMIERPFSIVSSPREKDVEFFLEMVPGGGLTPALHKMAVGETLWMRRQAKGRFTFDAQSGRKQHLFVATVTGIAPFVSMVREMAEDIRSGRRPQCQLFILHGASRSWEFAYRDELETLSRNCDWFRYIPTISRPWEDPSWKGEVGRVEDVLRKYVDALGLDASQTTAYLCGHAQMIVNSREILRRRGFPSDAIRQEAYWVPRRSDK